MCFLYFVHPCIYVCALHQSLKKFGQIFFTFHTQQFIHLMPVPGEYEPYSSKNRSSSNRLPPPQKNKIIIFATKAVTILTKYL
jgi:hypothetical protein